MKDISKFVILMQSLDQLIFSKCLETINPSSISQKSESYLIVYIVIMMSIQKSQLLKIQAFSIYKIQFISLLKFMFSDILQVQDYHATDPFVRDVIDEEIRRQLNNFGQNDLEFGKAKKGKTSQEQTLNNLKVTSDNRFKYLWAEDNNIDFDYQEEQRRKKDKQLELIQPLRFKVLGYTQQPGSNIKRPILRMSDMYLTTNSKVRRLIDRVFDRHIYGKNQTQKTQAGVLIAKSTSNVQQLEQILKNYQNKDEEYNFQNQQVKMNENELQDYIIDRGQSKSNYFLFYKNQEPAKIDYQVVNNPLKSQNFLKRLHAQVRQKQRQYYTIQDEESDQDSQKDLQEVKNKQMKKQSEQKKEKEYFGQFKRPGKSLKSQSKLKLEDQFQNKAKSGESLARSIIQYYSYMDSDIMNQQYKKSLQENDRLQLNLSNPYFFQPKLHTILTRQKQLMQQNEYKARLAEANKNRTTLAEVSLYSGANFSKRSAIGGASEIGGGAGQIEQQNITIEAKINAEIKNISRQPIKHSQIATKYQFVKFTLQEDVFCNYHRHFFPFHQHLNVIPRVEVHHHKNRKIKPNGLVINAQMKQSNQKFVRKEDLSCTKGQFIIVEYIEQTPILMSNVGMCQRMFIQVNYLEIIDRMRQQVFNQKSFEQMEQQRDRERREMPLSYIKHAELWRKMIKDTFGQNGKQFYWQPKNTSGKMIGIPDGPGVTVMQSNLGSVPILKKKPNPRDYLLVRDGKKWILRKIQNIYVSGQIQPSKKVFCPGSRQHTDFKLAYERAYIVKHLKQYQTVNFDQLKLTFKGQTQNSLRKALKSCNATSKDSKNFKIVHQVPVQSQQQLTPQDICLYERMQKSLCELKEVGIYDIRSNQKMKNVLKEFNKKYFQSSEKIAIARVIREQLQLTSWYLTDSFLKYKQKASKIEINGFADPTNGRGGYSYINKPQKQRTAREDMEQRAEKQKSLALSDLRKLNCESSRQRLRAMGHNEDEIQEKGRWALINLLKNKEGTQFSRRERETKYKKIENEKKQISKNFNRLLAWLRDETEQPAFDYGRQKRNKLADYIRRQKEYIQKIQRRYGTKSELGTIREENFSEDSDDQN